jgi:MYXO-CTERM domain-containing protein
VVAVLCWPLGSARAGTQDWEINEVLASAGGDSAVRYIELKNGVGGCFFPSSQIQVFDSAGVEVGSVSPSPTTICFGPDTYYLLATTGAMELFDTDADKQIVPQIPAAAGQVCFTSSTTRYDCVRWGSIADPIPDFFGVSDTTEATPPPDGMALARVSTTHVVVDDWQILDPTPRGPNDGTPWFPPDAGPVPDAGPTPDAAPIPDAAPQPDAWLLPDAGPRIDASDMRYLDVDPVGGATCSCKAGRKQSAPPIAWLLVAALAVPALRRRRRSR